MDWSRFSPEELERRRLESVAAMKAIEQAEFEAWYQEECDRDYWTFGQCCAGCDNWESDMGYLGCCVAVGIVPGEDVMKSLGAYFCSYTPPPGFPLTRGDFYCGKFKDDFDWSSLDRDYLSRIGAIRQGILRAKPSTRRVT